MKLDIPTKEIVKSYRVGTSASQLARDHRCSVWSIIERLRAAGVQVRSAKEQNACYLGDSRTREFTLVELMDGLMLGDASIDPKGFFRIDQRGDRLPWLRWIKLRLKDVGCDSSIIPIAARVGEIEGRQILGQPANLLYTPAYEELKPQRTRWYPIRGRGKQVPNDVTITALSVAQWFCGDGTNFGGYGFRFCTHRYARADVRRLIGRLADAFGIRPTTGSHRGKPVIHVLKRDDAFKLMELMKPFVPECFRYKFQGIRPTR